MELNLVKQWGLVVESPSEQIFRISQDTVLGNLLWLMIRMGVAQGLHSSLFYPKQFCDSVIHAYDIYAMSIVYLWQIHLLANQLPIILSFELWKFPCLVCKGENEDHISLPIKDAKCL